MDYIIKNLNLYIQNNCKILMPELTNEEKKFTNISKFYEEKLNNNVTLERLVSLTTENINNIIVDNSIYNILEVDSENNIKFIKKQNTDKLCFFIDDKYMYDKEELKNYKIDFAKLNIEDIRYICKLLFIPIKYNDRGKERSYNKKSLISKLNDSIFHNN